MVINSCWWLLVSSCSNISLKGMNLKLSLFRGLIRNISFFSNLTHVCKPWFSEMSNGMHIWTRGCWNIYLTPFPMFLGQAKNFTASFIYSGFCLHGTHWDYELWHLQMVIYFIWICRRRTEYLRMFKSTLVQLVNSLIFHFTRIHCVNCKNRKLLNKEMEIHFLPLENASHCFFSCEEKKKKIKNTSEKNIWHFSTYKFKILVKIISNVNKLKFTFIFFVLFIFFHWRKV